MALEPCPHNPTMRCPHKTDDCDHDDSVTCHYVTTATYSALTAYASISEIDTKRLSPAMRRHFKGLEKFLQGFDIPHRK